MAPSRLTPDQIAQVSGLVAQYRRRFAESLVSSIRISVIARVLQRGAGARIAQCVGKEIWLYCVLELNPQAYCGSCVKTYTGLTTGNLNFSTSQFIHLRLLCKNPFEPLGGWGR